MSHTQLGNLEVGQKRLNWNHTLFHVVAARLLQRKNAITDAIVRHLTVSQKLPLWTNQMLHLSVIQFESDKQCQGPRIIPQCPMHEHTTLVHY